jgi:hypothetical protein
MPDGFSINTDTLEEVSAALRRAGDELGKTPIGPDIDAGPLTAHFNKMVAKLVKDADQLSTGLLAASSEVDKTRQDYVNGDLQGSNRFRP